MAGHNNKVIVCVCYASGVIDKDLSRAEAVLDEWMTTSGIRENRDRNKRIIKWLS